MTWLKRAHVVTSGERGPPVVQVIERDTAPSQDSKSARQSPQPSKAATSSTLSAYVRQGVQLALCVRGRRVSRKEDLGVMRAHERRKPQTRKHAEGVQ
jgi:hypothetical protein